MEVGGGYSIHGNLPQPPPTSPNLHHPPPTFTTCSSEHPPQSRLQLARVAQSRADGAVEVEQQSAVRGVLEVVGVRDVEDFDDQLGLPLAPRVAGAGQPPVPGEDSTVLAESVPGEHAPISTVPVC